jgi:CCR4-NOT transcription complex subunit 7/8
MITSGLVLLPDTKWISFHRYVPTCVLSVFLASFPAHSGYDFGYFIKLLTAESLPTTEDDFFTLLHTWFPTIYDIKFLMRSCKQLKGGLQDVADDLGVRVYTIRYFNT